MITRLHIRHLILIDQATIHFGSGLNILSGETGSGKSAILSALDLIVGQRADPSIVRQGFEKAIVEAVFDIDAIPEVICFLTESGIEHEFGDELIICREIPVKGKGRVLINNQSASIALLKKIGESLLGIVGQHANQKLFSLDYHRLVLDLYGNMLEKVQRFRESFEKEKELKERIEVLKNTESERERMLERCLAEKEEISEANVQEGEDEALFEEYSKLLNAEEIMKVCYEIHQAFDEGVLPQLLAVKKRLDHASSLDAYFEEVATHFQSHVVELQELAFAVEKSKERYDVDPSRLEEVNERLSLIAKLKKKYGDLFSVSRRLKNQIAELENTDTALEEFEKELNHQHIKNEKLANEISDQRKKTAATFETSILHHLRQLNMPHATFSVVFFPIQRSMNGDESVEFFFTPNIGERLISVRDSASGGELSRVMLAIQTLLAGKEKIPTLLFDEIDANIGGETAVVVGDKLKEIARNHQVLCVTHFPQVAKKADHHLCIRKVELDGRTVTIVDELKEEAREQELNRMLGLSYVL